MMFFLVLRMYQHKLQNLQMVLIEVKHPLLRLVTNLFKDVSPFRLLACLFLLVCGCVCRQSGSSGKGACH